MNEFRKIFAEGILDFPEKHEEDKVKLNRLVNAFRAAWKVYKDPGDEKIFLDMFIKEMDNKLWDPEELEVNGV